MPETWEIKTTPADLVQTRLFPFTGEVLNFQVKGAGAVAVGMFHENDAESYPQYYLCCNEWFEEHRKMLAVIYKNGVSCKQVETRRLIDDGDYSAFWLAVHDRTVQFGNAGNTAAPIIDWTDCEQIPINFVGIWSNDDAHWIIENTI